MTGRPTLDEAIEAAMHGDDIVPSPGFVDAVMTSVRAEASTPPPIAFPWARVWPAVALGAALTAAPLIMLRPAPASARAESGAVADISAMLTGLAANPDLQLALLAIGLTWLLILIPGRLRT
jgi:hypothetical protein